MTGEGPGGSLKVQEPGMPYPRAGGEAMSSGFLCSSVQAFSGLHIAHFLE